LEVEAEQAGEFNIVDVFRGGEQLHQPDRQIKKTTYEMNTY
jgi:hypothetical protein